MGDASVEKVGAGSDGDGRETELEHFKRKYHEAMDILTAWDKIDHAEAVAKMLAAQRELREAEATHERAFESVVRINERLCRELEECKRRLDTLAQGMAGL